MEELSVGRCEVNFTLDVPDRPTRLPLTRLPLRRRLRPGSGRPTDPLSEAARERLRASAHTDRPTRVRRGPEIAGLAKMRCRLPHLRPTDPPRAPPSDPPTTGPTRPTDPTDAPRAPDPFVGRARPTDPPWSLPRTSNVKLTSRRAASPLSSVRFRSGFSVAARRAPPTLRARGTGRRRSLCASADPFDSNRHFWY